MINHTGSKIILRYHNILLNRETPYQVQEFATALLYSPCCRYHRWSIRREINCLQGNSTGGKHRGAEQKFGKREYVIHICHLIAYIFSISATDYTNGLS
jgi:hypothetical protein